jgi:hypothetical protein
MDRPGGPGPPGRLSAAGNQGGEITAIVIRDNAKPTWLAGLAGVRRRARDMVQRAMACAAAAILICAVAAALAQLAAEFLSFPAPIAVTAMTLMAAALLDSLCRHLRTSARHRSGPGNPHSRPRQARLHLTAYLTESGPGQYQPPRRPTATPASAVGPPGSSPRTKHLTRTTTASRRRVPAGPGRSPANGSTARETVHACIRPGPPCAAGSSHQRRTRQDLPPRPAPTRDARSEAPKTHYDDAESRCSSMAT